MDEAGIPGLQAAIRDWCGCESTWIESVAVREVQAGLVVWDGDVEVFDITGHPKTTRAYAWSYESMGTARRYKVVLGIPPVDDAVTAVRVAIMADSQRPRR
jgi:hypothetical protein